MPVIVQKSISNNISLSIWSIEESLDFFLSNLRLTKNCEQRLDKLKSDEMKKQFLAVRKLIQLRYQLLPILYSAIWRFYKEGEPVIRPLFLDFPEKEHFEQEEVFSINERIIVAPVLVKKRNRIKVFLPFCREGWFDYFNLKFISRGGWVNINAPINKLPIIIRGGTLIPKLKVNFHKPHLAPIKEMIIFPSLIKLAALS